jgi:N-ethylmaleimide reductase
MNLPHRLVMAPMTRNRSTPEGVPTEMNAEYYAQRASTALIISEGSQPNDDGQGYLLTPGIYTDAHIAGWRKVTEAVHAAGGQIVIQMMHVGRIGHPSNTPHGRQPVGPSAVQANVKMATRAGMQDVPVPRALEVSEIAATVRDYAHAAAAAMEAGADGVEIHGANGYIVHQFLSDNVNQRTDNYGGSVANRIRFAVEVAAAVADKIGAGRTGIRIAPGNKFNDIVETHIREVYEPLVRELAKLKLAYLHVNHMGDDALLQTIRDLWPGVLLVNRGRTDMATRIADIEKGLADVITVGAMNLANPDLVERLKLGAPLNTPDPTTFYGGGAKGYTDYPTLAMAASNG